jgi:hypothetical protein
LAVATTVGILKKRRKVNRHRQAIGHDHITDRACVVAVEGEQTKAASITSGKPFRDRWKLAIPGGATSARAHGLLRRPQVEEECPGITPPMACTVCVCLVALPENRFKKVVPASAGKRKYI